MKRRIFAIILALSLALAAAAPVFAMSDATYSSDATLTNFINRFNNVVIKSGVTLTMKDFKPDPQGLEIYGSLTLEEGAKIVGNGQIIFARNALCSGLDMYYIVRGKEVKLNGTLADLVALFPQADYKPTFAYNGSTGHWYLYGNTFDADPFNPDAGGGSDRAEDNANRLKELGLFRGSDIGFELDRQPTRIEALVMLIRLLGKEAEAKAGTWTQPFTDIPAGHWAEKEIGYAYEHGLTAGIGGGLFGVTGADNRPMYASAQMFSTFCLRALGYSDDTQGGTDFTYAAATAAAEEHGLLSGEGDVTNFNRGVCVNMMEAALRQSMKNGDLLWHKLSGEGVFPAADYERLFVNR